MPFIDKHIGPNQAETANMLAAVGVSSIEELIQQTVPAEIRLKGDLNLPKAVSESRYLQTIKELASKNQVYKSYIGMGYYNTNTPTVILRNILENPGWYTAYTPYQAEIAQGRLEALINFQTAVTDLTGMEIANASLLDEATAAAEAMTMFYSLRKGNKKNASTLYVSDALHPQTIDLLITRANPIDIQVTVVNSDELEQAVTKEDCFGIFVNYPDTNGEIIDFTSLFAKAKANDVFSMVATDLLALTLLKSPGEMGADVVVGTSQRFGVPMGYGGPHAAFFATKDEFKRQIPGRIIGISIDSQGKPAYRMALQTREQHIRREKATSNICTSQVLLAVMAGFYAVYHGPVELKRIASRIHKHSKNLAFTLEQLGFEVLSKSYFDTIRVKCDAGVVKSIAENEKINFRYYSKEEIGISLDETTDSNDLLAIIGVFAKAVNIDDHIPVSVSSKEIISSNLKRTSAFLTQDVFNKYHNEHEVLRYIKRLESKDLSMVHSMISLGSCTMKLNASSEMIPITWPEFANIHPFAPEVQAGGYTELFRRLNQWLCEITGFAKISFQPNSGAQGEYAGLLVIRNFHINNKEAHRNVALIPSSAHGTNPASAAMVGMKIIIVNCDEKGNIDVADLKAKAELHKDNLSCLMVTYPSTHGVFEGTIIEICKTIHSFGGQVYMDGANMNAQVGLTSPATIGADVCHLNLHKTFCIPHGGGGPGVGPIGVAEHLVPFLPGHAVKPPHKSIENNHAVSAAPYGSAGILPIPYGYMMMMGGEGLKNATEYAILNANYMMSRLSQHYKILYTGVNGRCAHEFIVDFREFKHSVGIEVEDVAKRLMDYGFHAPTVSFPVAGTLMIEPTESESKGELDRFCDALISIRKEIAEIENGTADKTDNVLKNAPHAMTMIVTDSWNHSYSREKAAFPSEWSREFKFWPAVGRINSAHGDRNLICTCAPISDYVS